jgi:gamma-glutamylcyclotransferase (GGCT)/AIG2-like uncharacterized protein YtfP
MTDRVFVYGSLRRGQSNAHFLDHARLLGEHTTAPRFSLHKVFGYPAAVPGGSDALRGEVYEIDMSTLAALDRLEDYPDVYQRQRIETAWGDAWIYVMLEKPADE